jgi:hypothetical protein
MHNLSNVDVAFGAEGPLAPVPLALKHANILAGYRKAGLSVPLVSARVWADGAMRYTFANGNTMSIVDDSVYWRNANGERI